MPDLGLGGLVDVLSRLETKAIRVHPQRCSKLRHRRSSCTLCADVCPTGAIVWRDASLEVEPSKCSGCGLCAAVCPTGALEAQAPTNADLLVRTGALAQERGWVALACPRGIRAGGDEGRAYLSVGCLGRLDEAVLVGAVALGCKTVALIDGACAGCAQARGHDVAAQMVERARALLAAYGLAERVALLPCLPPELAAVARALAPASSLSRRGLFSSLARETAKAGAVAADSLVGGGKAEPEVGPKRGPLPVALPAKRQQLLAALKRLGKPTRSVALPAGLWARFAYRSACTGCRMCAFFCPTGALEKAEKDGQEGIVCRAAICTDCGLCRDICYREAVMLTADVDLLALLEDRPEWLPMRTAGQDQPEWLARLGV